MTVNVAQPAIRAWAIIQVPGGADSRTGRDVGLEEVGGTPLVARTIAAALAAATIGRVFVSTGDPAVAALARAAGAEVIDRPNAGDTAASPEAALLDALDVLERRGETLPDAVAWLGCDWPFTRAADIDGTLAALAGGADSALAVAPIRGPVWRIADGTALAVDPAPGHVETGAIHAMRTAGFRKARHRRFGRTALHETPAERAMAIGGAGDLALARALAPVLDGDAPSRAAASLPPAIDAIVFDFDGVMTDDRMIQHQDGSEAVICSRSDGMGVERARDAGLRMMILSKERNPVVARRAAKLRLECHQSVDAKGPALAAWIADNGLDAARVVYLGNDLNDLPAFAEVGCRVAVADAHPALRAAADIVLRASGGRGAVRELCEMAILIAPGGSSPR